MGCCVPRPAIVAALVMIPLVAAGCASPRFSATALDVPLLPMGSRAIPTEHFALDDSAPHDEQPDPRRLPMFLGSTGKVIAWNDLLRAAEWADVILVGEEHDDAVGHAVELAVMQDIADRWPHAALSMEMLERDDQLLVDDYLDGIIDAGALETLTHSKGWAGEGSWASWYQPVIDVAKAHNQRVIAANAPRRYVRMARQQGYDALAKLPAPRRELFSLPKGSLDNPYRDRFLALMNEMSEGDASAAAHAASQSQAMASFRSQYLWDSTMADSIVRGLKAGATKVVHLAGRFHVEREGGTVLQVRERRPGTRVLTIVMSREGSLTMLGDDRDLADIVIYTGKRPEPEAEADEPAEAPEPAEEPATEPKDISAPPSPGEDDPELPTTAPSDPQDAR